MLGKTALTTCQELWRASVNHNTGQHVYSDDCESSRKYQANSVFAAGQGKKREIHNREKESYRGYSSYS